MATQETLQKLLYELQYLREVAENIKQRIVFVNATIREVQIASATLEGICNEEVGSPMFIPIGSGSYIRAKLDDREKIIVSVGAEVAIEKTITVAKEDFENRNLELEKAQISLQQQLDGFSTKINGLEMEIQKIMQQQSGKT